MLRKVTKLKCTNIAFLEYAPCFYAFMLIYVLFLQLRITWLTFSLYWNLTCLSKHHLDATSSLKRYLITHMSVLILSSKFLLLFVYASFLACKTVSLIFEFLIEALFLPQNCKLLKGRKDDLFIPVTSTKKTCPRMVPSNFAFRVKTAHTQFSPPVILWGQAPFWTTAAWGLEKSSRGALEFTLI